MKLRILLMILLVGAGAAQLPAQTTLATLAASLDPGEWGQLTGITGLVTAGESIFSEPGVSACAVTQFSDKAAWDPVTKRLFFLGSCHQTGYKAFVQYDDTTNTFSLLPLPPQNVPGTLVPSHSYQHITIDSVARRFYQRHYGTGVILQWNIDAATWSQFVPPISAIYTGNGNDSLEFFPDLNSGLGGLVFHVGSFGSIAYFNTTQSAWINITNMPPGSMGSRGTIAQYSPVAKTVLFGGGAPYNYPDLTEAKKLWRLKDDLTFIQSTDAPGGVGPTQSVSTVDPVTGEYLFIFPASDSAPAPASFWSYNAVTDVWVRISTSTPLEPAPLGLDGWIAAPVSNYGVTLFVKNSGASSQVWVYKHGASVGDTTPPLISAVTASAITTTAATITWTTSEASDSQVEYGTTTAYGSQTTLNASMVTPHSVNLTGLLASTLYHYRVKSKDAAANLATGTDRTLTTASAGSTVFSQKCAAVGVVGCFGFDSQAAFKYSWPTVAQTGFNGCDTAFTGQTNYSFTNQRNSGEANTVATLLSGNRCNYPVVDNLTFHGSSGGTGALRLKIPSQSFSGATGFYSEPFKGLGQPFIYFAPGSPDGNVYYFQYYYRISPEINGTYYRGTGGRKLVIQYGNPPNGSSSSTIEITSIAIQDYGDPGCALGEASCPNGNAAQQLSAYSHAGAYGYGQNQGGCTTNYNGLHPLYQDPPCFNLTASRWYEVTTRLEIIGAPDAPTSRLQMWVDGRLILDNNTVRVNWGSDHGDGLGQFNFNVYMTGKDETQVHAEGFIWYDDLVISKQAIAMSGAAGPDVIVPTVSVTAPAPSVTVSGSSVAVTADAADDVAVASVRFTLDGVALGATDTASPWAITWNTTQASNAAHLLRAIARDAAGNETTSASVSVTVDNVTPPPADTTAPVISTTTPAAGATVGGSFSITATATDNVAVAGVQFKVDGVNAGPEDITAPYSFFISTIANGVHTLSAVARDAAGNLTTATTVTVTVSSPPDSTAPVVQFLTASGTTFTNSKVIQLRITDNAGAVICSITVNGQSAPDIKVFTAGATLPRTTQFYLQQATIPQGTYVLGASCRDAAGNTGAAVPITVYRK